METFLNVQECTKIIVKKFTDHRSFSFNVTLPCILTNNKKKPMINFKNTEGWDSYKKISDTYAQGKNSYYKYGNTSEKLRDNMGGSK